MHCTCRSGDQGDLTSPNRCKRRSFLEAIYIVNHAFHALSLHVPDQHGRDTTRPNAHRSQVMDSWGPHKLPPWGPHKLPP